MTIKNIKFKIPKVNKYVKIGICVLIVLITCILIFRSCSSDATKSNMENTYGNYEVTDGRIKYQPKDKGENDMGYIKFAGYGQYEVSKEQPNIELSNPDVNFTDFVFTVKDSESKKLIGKTDKVFVPFVSSGIFLFIRNGFIKNNAAHKNCNSKRKIPSFGCYENKANKAHCSAKNSGKNRRNNFVF